MARTPQVNKTPNPAAHFFDWAGGGEGGHFTYYDKAKKENRKVALPFNFIFLNELATVRGWCDATDSGIFSNEVLDTRSEVMVVKSFEGGVIASGLYSDIRDRVVAAGGRYTANVYVAIKEDGVLKIGCVQFHGAALNAWVEFRKEAGQKLWEKAISVTSCKDGKKGSIKFKTPVFSLTEIKKETEDAAGVLQELLKAFHADYFARTKTQQATQQAAESAPASARGAAPSDEPPADDAGADAVAAAQAEEDQNVPF